jgi:hypothetical protein
MNQIYSGKNKYKTFYRAAKIISANIAREKGVVGIVGTGAIGRKYGDYFSDLDLIVYAQDKSIKKLEKLVSIGWISYKNVSYDILIESFKKAKETGSPSRYWNQLRRWDLENSQILYDPKNKIKKLLKEKLIYPEHEQKRLMAKYKNEIQEFLIYFPEMWAIRGQLYNIADSLVHAVRNITLWIYAKNKAFEPYQSKWPFYHLENKTVPEHIYLKELTNVYSTPVKNLNTLMNIRKQLIQLCKKIGLEFDIYSTAEAFEKCEKNWEKINEKSKEIFKW